MIDVSKMQFHGISFAGKHTWKDYRLFLDGSPSIGKAEVQSILLDIPGRDGLLRLTQSRDGSVHYRNRSFSCTLVPNNRATFIETVSTIANLIHGKQCQMIWDGDSNYSYTGEFYVEADYPNCTLNITGSLEPFKTHRTSGAKSL